MAVSLLSYFCTMVTACIVLMMVLSHIVPPPARLQQPHFIPATAQIRMSAEPREPRAGTRLSAHRSSARAAQSSIVD
jgi:hypothetical protein